MLRIGLLVMLISSVVWADGKATECTRLWQLEKEMGCPQMPSDFTPAPQSPTKPDNFLVSSDFGPSKCVTRDSVDKEKKELKKECDEWIGERKKDLGSSFKTGTCNAQCSPCPKQEALSRCTMHGEVHYIEKM